jgi:SAM-dependent methyltransferase
LEQLRHCRGAKVLDRTLWVICFIYVRELGGRLIPIRCRDVVIALFNVLACTSAGSDAVAIDGAAPAPVALFNGRDFAGWDSYLGPPDGSVQPVGLNRDPQGMFSVVTIDGGPAIHISGEIWGAIITQQEFETYHLRTEYKWGTHVVWPPLTLRDSGLLYHSVGPFGAVQRVGRHAGKPGGHGGPSWRRWNQIAENDVGSCYSLGPITVDGGVFASVAPAQFESPVGEWNTVEVFALRNESLHLLNGHPVVHVHGATLNQSDGGSAAPLVHGKIQLRFESMEVFFRCGNDRPDSANPDRPPRRLAIANSTLVGDAWYGAGIMAPRAIQRRNLAGLEGEKWKPPVLEAPHTTLQRFAFGVRRYFDLQAGSVWNDVADLVSEASGKVVDVGCGGQPYRSLLPASVEYQGIDIAEVVTKFGYQAPDTVYFSGSEWPKEAKDADLLLCTEVLEHVQNPAAFLREAFQCLRPGGRLIATVPFAARWHFVPFDYWRFTPSGLKQLLDQAGFRNVRVWARGNAMTVACYKAMALFLPLFFSQEQSRVNQWLRRMIGAPGTPLFVLLATVANVSLRLEGGEDCLGYTVLADRPSSA